jgi:hypothetical protein
MRKLFAAIMSVSAVAVLLGGVALAWTTTASGSYQVSAGALSVKLVNPTASGLLLYPTGNPIIVAYGNIENDTPANPGIAVVATGGSVTAISDAAYCGITDGGVAITTGGWVNPGGAQGDVWQASLTMSTAAPNNCQNDLISYTVNVNVTTP